MVAQTAFRTLLVCFALVLPSFAAAQLSKSDCKAHAANTKKLMAELGLSAENTGRELLNAVETWIEGHDAATLERVIARIEETTEAVEACDDAGFTSQVTRIKGMSQKLSTAVLPWMRSKTAVDACQGLVNQAVRKRSEDLDGAIADLEKSAAECDDETWRNQALQNLAALYYQRGDLEQRDFATAMDRTRQALQIGEGLDDASRKVLRAILARSAIEAGQTLMERQAYEPAERHWRAYMDTFGTPSFDVLFDVDQVAQGAWPFREMTDARYQRTLACLALGKVDCVRESMLGAAAEHEDDPQPIKDLTERVFERAAEASLSEHNDLYTLGFDLLTAWHEFDPDAYQISRLLKESLLVPGREERLELLRLTDKCWIPVHVADTLRQENEEFVAEAEIAAACGATGAEAEAMLAEFHLQAARDKLDRVAFARTNQERRAALAEVEKLLAEVADTAHADEMRAKIAAERMKMQQATASAEREKTGMYENCTEVLAIIQWNKARENDYDSQERNFKDGCCRLLASNESAWVQWMRAKPESERLADAEIDKKNELMKRYCTPSNR